MAIGDYFRYGVYGAASQVPSVVLGIPGALGFEPAERAYEAVDTRLRDWLGTPDYKLMDAPGYAAAEALGGSLIGGWGGVARGAATHVAPAVVSGGYQLLKDIGRTAAGVVGYNPKLTAKTVAAGTVANMGIREGIDIAHEAATEEPVRDEDGFVLRDADGFMVTKPANKIAEGVVAALPYVGAAVAGLGGAQAVHELRQRGVGKLPPSNPDDTIGAPIQPVEPPANAIQPSLTTKVTTALVNNQTAGREAIREAERAGNISADDADRVRQHATIGLQQAARSNKVMSDLMDGNLGSGHAPITSAQRMTEIADAMTPEQRMAYNKLREFENEQNNRVVNSNRNVLHPQWGPNVNFKTKSDAFLQQEIATARADPIVAAHADMAKARNLAMLYWARSEGVYDAATTAKIRKDNPDWLHNIVNKKEDDAAAGTKSPLDERLRKPGEGYESGIDATLADMDAEKQLRNFVYRNRAIREMAETLQQHRTNMLAADPNAKLWVGRIIAQNDKVAKGFEAIPYRDAQGRRLAIEVVPDVAKMMRTGERLTVPFLSASTRTLQSTITGVPGAIFSSPFAAASAGMAASAAQALAPKHVATGLIDKGLLKATGGRVSFKADPTLMGVMAYDFGAGMLAQTAQSVAGALNRSIDHNGVFTKLVGAPTVQKWADGAMNAYLNSQVHENRAAGSSGLGVASGNLTSQQGDVTMRQLNPSFAKKLPTVHPWQTVSNLTDAERWLSHAVIDGQAKGFSLVPASVQRAYGFAEAALDILGSTAASSIVRLNKKTPGIHGMVRDITGDPAQRPAQRHVAAAVGTVPFGNTMLQSANAWGRGFRNAPQTTVTRMMMQAGVVAGLSALSNIFADEQEAEDGFGGSHIQAALNEPSTRAGRVTISIPGLPYEQGMQLTVDPMVAPFVAMAKHMMLNMIGADHPDFLGEAGAPMREHFKDYMQVRAEKQANSAMLRATGFDARGALPIPPIVDMAWRTRDALADPGTKDIGAPGYTDTQLVGDPVNVHMANLLDSMFGAVGATFKELMRTIGFGSQAPDASISKVSRAAATIIGMQQEKGARLAAPLLQATPTKPVSDQMAETVKQLEDGFARINAGFGDVKKPGTIGAGHATQMPTAGPGRDDVHPEMVPILASFNKISQKVAGLQQLRKSYYEDNRSMQADPQLRLHPRELSMKMNANITEMHKINADLYDVITQHEKGLSDAVQRKITLRVPIDVKRGLDQFPPLR